MKKTTKHGPEFGSGFSLSDRTFAAITAVEGLSLTEASKDRLMSMRKRKLTPDQQRSEVIRAYSGSKIHR